MIKTTKNVLAFSSEFGNENKFEIIFIYFKNGRTKQF